MRSLRRSWLPRWRHISESPHVSRCWTKSSRPVPNGCRSAMLQMSTAREISTVTIRYGLNYYTHTPLPTCEHQPGRKTAGSVNMVISIEILEMPPRESKQPPLERKARRSNRSATRPRSRYFRQRSRAEKGRQDRRQDLCRDAVTARSLRPAVRQRPAPRRHGNAQARVPVGEHERARARCGMRPACSASRFRSAA